jgi:hypothetical protein
LLLLCVRSLLSIREDKPEHAQQLVSDSKDVSVHLMEMSERIKEKSDDIQVKNSWFPLSKTLDSVLAPIVSSTDGKIVVEKIL